jgi:hypothetical protein
MSAGLPIVDTTFLDRAARCLLLMGKPAATDSHKVFSFPPWFPPFQANSSSAILNHYYLMSAQLHGLLAIRFGSHPNSSMGADPNAAANASHDLAWRRRVRGTLKVLSKLRESPCEPAPALGQSSVMSLSHHRSPKFDHGLRSGPVPLPADVRDASSALHLPTRVVLFRRLR